MSIIIAIIDHISSTINTSPPSPAKAKNSYIPAFPAYSLCLRNIYHNRRSWDKYSMGEFFDIAKRLCRIGVRKMSKDRIARTALSRLLWSEVFRGLKKRDRRYDKAKRAAIGRIAGKSSRTLMKGDYIADKILGYPRIAGRDRYILNQKLETGAFPPKQALQSTEKKNMLVPAEHIREARARFTLAQMEQERCAKTLECEKCNKHFCRMLRLGVTYGDYEKHRWVQIRKRKFETNGREKWNPCTEKWEQKRSMTLRTDAL